VQSTSEDFHESTGPPFGKIEPNPGLQPLGPHIDSGQQRLVDSGRFSRSPKDSFLPQSIVNNLPGMVYRCQFDKNWTMDFISDGCKGLTGYLPSELLKNKAISYAQIIHPDDREKVWEDITTALQSKASFDIIYRINTKESGMKWVRELGRALFVSGNEITALEGFITDITDRVLSEQRVERQVKRFEALRRIDMAINASFDLRVTLDILLDQVTVLLNVDAAGILLYNYQTQLLEYAAGRGFQTGAIREAKYHLGEGFAGKAILERRPITVRNITPADADEDISARFEAESFQTYLGIPLITKGEVKGILEIFHRSDLHPDAEWQEFLETLAGQAAIAVENATLFQDLQRSNIELTLAYDATLEGWSKALELRDQETQGHSQRVTEMTLRVAQVVGIDQGELKHIRRGALLHDIGKMAIPDNILLKPGPLTKEEWLIMRNHPIYAYRLLSPIANLRPALDIPYCHHEKWDGSGYPRGLKDLQIPLAARIFAVVDVWDALLSDRTYRPAWKEPQVVQYIKDQSSLHFDPKIVNIFMHLL
jgi:PAS domain S-box-containing protein